ncbi:MAG TPA: alpha-L-rhamnosidase N-terminal domain-containing protein, partial [Solimonas sp.]|nr:alpha-L-rhamnosidase N-terminal domain-containing protein [Solimonas sp.]
MRSAKWLAVLAGGLALLSGLSGCATPAPGTQPHDGPVSSLPFDLKTEYASTPLGLDEAQPRFSWRLPDGAGDGRQSAYRIRVANSAQSLNDSALWDSGRRQGRDTAQIAYEGPALQSRTRYWWQVQVRDGHGRTSGWSAPSWWEMGLLKPDDWSAQWISGRTTLDHDWHDARITFDFTLTGSGVGFLFRARPVGKTYGEAYLWRIMKVGGALQWVAQVRRYPGGSSSTVAVSTLRSLPIAAGKDWTTRRHSLVIETRGKTLTTTLDGVVLGTLEDDAETSGTIGFVANEPDAAIIHAVAVENGGADFRTDFSDGINPFTGGSLVAGGLQVAAGVPDKDLVLPIAAPAPLLRRAFTLTETPVSARLYVAVGGFADLSVNGTRVGHSLQDGYTDYDKRVLYRSFDVSDALRAGDNVIAAELGRGWYGVTEPNEWYWHMAPWHAAPTLRAQLELRYADGRTQRIVSDG